MTAGCSEAFFSGNKMWKKYDIRLLLTGAAAAAAGTAYAFYIRYLPLYAVILTSVSLAALNLFFVYLLYLLIRYRAGNSKHSARPPLVDYLLVTLFFAGGTVSGLLPSLLPAAALWIWISWVFLKSSSPWFYTLTAGFLILLGVNLSYRILGSAEQIWISLLTQNPAEEEVKLKITWETKPSGEYNVYNYNQKVALFSIPESMKFHPPSASPEFLPWPVPGYEVFRLVSDESLPDRPPVIILWRLRSGSPSHPGEYISSFQLFLGFLKNRSGAEDIRLEDQGQESYVTGSGLTLNAVSWSFFPGSRSVRSRLSILTGGGWFLLVLEENPAGFPFSERTRDFLNNLHLY